jgi:hypothetical protein
MNFVIQFIGIVLFIKLSGPGGITTYHVVMPNEGNVCGKKDFADHHTYIRIPPNSEASTAVNWPFKYCKDKAVCTLYPIDDVYIQIGNVATTGPVTGTLNAFHLRSFLDQSYDIQSGLGAAQLTNAEMDITTGNLVGDTLGSGMRDTLWNLKTLSSNSKYIVITAIPRSGGDPSVLTLNAGTTVQIVNTPEENAMSKIGEIGGADNHFYIYYHIIDPEPPADKCGVPQGAPMLPMGDQRSRSPKETKEQPDTGVSIACSNSQWP